MNTIQTIHVMTSVSAGGMSRYILDLMSKLDRRQFESHLICTHFKGPHFDEALPLFDSVTQFQGRRQLTKLHRLWSTMRRLRPHVVHAHQEPVALIAARLARIPVRMETIYLAEYWLQDARPIIRSLARKCATLHVVCNDQEKRSILPLTDVRKVQVIHPGLNMDRWKGYWDKKTVPCADRIPPGAYVVGTIARLDPQKGLCHFLDACPIILRHIPQAIFLIVGDGSQRSALEQQAQAFGIADRTVFTGYHNEAYRFLGAMDVFMMSSLFESWGYTAVEAMAAGLPVVCTDIPGPTEFVFHEETGLLVKPGNADAIADSVLRLHSDGKLSESIAAAGRKLVRERHTIQAMVSAYERLYREACAEHPAIP